MQNGLKGLKFKPFKSALLAAPGIFQASLVSVLACTKRTMKVATRNVAGPVFPIGGFGQTTPRTEKSVGGFEKARARNHAMMRTGQTILRYIRATIRQRPALNE